MTIIKSIRSKILSITNITKLTKAMEMVSFSRFKKIKKILSLNNFYTKNIKDIICRLKVSCLLDLCHSCFEERKSVKNVCYFVITSDKGLVGSLNIKIFKKFSSHITTYINKGINIHVVLIGSKAVDYFDRYLNKINVLYIFNNIKDNNIMSVELLNSIKCIFQQYNEKILDKIYILSNKFVNNLLQVPFILPVFPILDENIFVSNKKYGFLYNYLYEPNINLILDILLYRYIKSLIYRAIIENFVCEYASRMIVMKSSTDNGFKLINDMHLICNKIRQNNITRELSEIISGANVM